MIRKAVRCWATGPAEPTTVGGGELNEGSNGDLNCEQEVQANSKKNYYTSAGSTSYCYY